MNDMPNMHSPYDEDSLTTDEGGLRAPSHLHGWRKWWWWFDFIILVKLARLRFIGILLLIGIILTQWDLLVSYYDKWTRPALAGDAAGGVFEWFCPMHPSVIRNNSKEKCPICFMPLSKRKKGDGTVEALPAGVVSRVQLSPYRVVLAGVQTWTVDYVPLSKEITAVGYVEFNESGQRSISARFNGRVDKLFVSQTGRMVEEGDELASLYSPELVVAMKSLLDAKKAGNRELLTSTQTRLQLLGISDDQVNEILTTGISNTHLKIRSPINGHIIRKYIREGQYVQEGMPLFDVADLNTVWIQAQVYEDDLLFLPEELTHNRSANVAATLPVIATTKALPNEEFHGMLTFVYPHVDQQTRTVTVRFELDNPQHKLRPGSTASVKLEVPPERWALLSGIHEADAERRARLEKGELLAVPQSAVIDTGSQKIVYREVEPSVFEGVLVKLGPKMTGPDDVIFFPVLHGLEPGTKVVTSGSFLVDAETRLNPSAGSIYFGGSGGAGSGKSSVTAVRPTTPDDPDAKILAALAKLSPEDRKLADSQRYCPVLTQNRLGSMGAPVKITVDGETVFLCCAGCKDNALSDTKSTLAKVKAAREKKDAAPSAVANNLAATSPKEEREIKDSLAKLDAADRKLAEAQRFCVISGESRLGSMGKPMKLMIDGQPVFLCCEGCKDAALADKAATTQKAKQLQTAKPPLLAEKPASLAEQKIATALAKLTPEDQKLAEAQRFCPVLEKSRLGSMGPPVKLMIDGQPVFLCCSSCREMALKNPQKTLEKVKALTGGKRD